MFNSTNKNKSTMDSSSLIGPKSTYGYFKGFMKDFFRLDGLYAVYLGFAITAFGTLSITTWQWWAIIVPTIMMVNFFKKEE